MGEATRSEVLSQHSMRSHGRMSSLTGDDERRHGLMAMQPLLHARHSTS